MFARLLRARAPRRTGEVTPADSLVRACDVIMRSRTERAWTSVRPSSLSHDMVAEPPAAASAELVFRREYPGGSPIEIPRGTRVSTRDADRSPQVFMTSRAARIECGQNEARVVAYHAELIDAELLGVTTDLDRIWTLARPPVVAAVSTDLELRIGVDCDPSDVHESDRVTMFDHRVFLLWSELNPGWKASAGTRRFIADRLSGEIVPLLRLRQDSRDGDRPAVGSDRPREVRAWYWRGGGAAGNVEAGAITVLRDSLRGVVVTNPAAARGGRDAALHAMRTGYRLAGPSAEHEATDH